MSYDTVEEMAEANRAAGHCWFEPGSNDYFNTQYHTGVLGGRYFITSEQDEEFGMYYQPWNGERRYTVRMCDDRGAVRSVGSFGQYDTLEAAMAWIQTNVFGHDIQEAGK